MIFQCQIGQIFYIKKIPPPPPFIVHHPRLLCNPQNAPPFITPPLLLGIREYSPIGKYIQIEIIFKCLCSEMSLMCIFPNNDNQLVLSNYNVELKVPVASTVFFPPWVKKDNF